MKKALWLASVVCLAVATWATLESAPVQASGTYAGLEATENGDMLARRRGGSCGSSGRSKRSRGSYGSCGGSSRRSRGSHGSYGSHG